MYYCLFFQFFTTESNDNLCIGVDEDVKDALLLLAIQLHSIKLGKLLCSIFPNSFLHTFEDLKK